MSLTIEIPEGIVIPDYLLAAMRVLAAGSGNMRPLAIGETATVSAPLALLYMLRQDATTLVVSKDPLTPAAIDLGGDYSWAKAKWDLLLAGADTPEGRRDLAESMLRKGGIPCGACKTSWAAALLGLTAEHLATPEAFHKWVWSERQRIAVSKGRAAWPYPEGDFTA